MIYKTIRDGILIPWVLVIMLAILSVLLTAVDWASDKFTEEYRTPTTSVVVDKIMINKNSHALVYVPIEDPTAKKSTTEVHLDRWINTEIGDEFIINPKLPGSFISSSVTIVMFLANVISILYLLIKYLINSKGIKVEYDQELKELTVYVKKNQANVILRCTVDEDGKFIITRVSGTRTSATGDELIDLTTTITDMMVYKLYEDSIDSHRFLAWKTIQQHLQT